MFGFQSQPFCKCQSPSLSSTYMLVLDLVLQRYCVSQSRDRSNRACTGRAGTTELVLPELEQVLLHPGPPCETFTVNSMPPSHRPGAVVLK